MRLLGEFDGILCAAMQGWEEEEEEEKEEGGSEGRGRGCCLDNSNCTAAYPFVISGFSSVLLKVI